MADDDDNKAGPLTTRQQGNHLTRPTTWVDRELEDTIARKARAGRQLTEVEVELERAKLEFYREMIEVLFFSFFFLDKIIWRSQIHLLVACPFGSFFFSFLLTNFILFFFSHLQEKKTSWKLLNS